MDYRLVVGWGVMGGRRDGSVACAVPVLLLPSLSGDDRGHRLYAGAGLYIIWGGGFFDFDEKGEAGKQGPFPPVYTSLRGQGGVEEAIFACRRVFVCGCAGEKRYTGRPQR